MLSATAATQNAPITNLFWAHWRPARRATEPAAITSSGSMDQCHAKAGTDNA